MHINIFCLLYVPQKSSRITLKNYLFKISTAQMKCGPCYKPLVERQQVLGARKLSIQRTSCQLSTHPSFPSYHYNHPRVSSSIPDIFKFMSMFTEFNAVFIGLCLEGFFYGKISILCALTCTVANYSPIQDSIPEYSVCIFNTHRTSPRWHLSFSTLSVFSTSYLLRTLSLIY